VRRGELDKRVENAKTKFDNLVENAIKGYIQLGFIHADNNDSTFHAN
jgi:hypothetical protein